MNPKEKAEELLDKFWLMDNVTPMLSKEQSKQCALIAVDELIEQERKIDDYYEIGSYWQEVKQEINNL